MAEKSSQLPKDSALVNRRQNEILDMAALIFAKEGYRQTDVQVIADRLEVGKGTVYRYFPTKQQLFFSAVDRVMRRLQERLHTRAYPVEDPLERVEAGIREYLSFFDEHPEFVELLMLERAEFKQREQPTYFRYRDESLEYWKGTIEELIRSGRVRQVPVTRILEVVSDLLYGAIFTNLFSGRRKTFEEQARDILDIVFYGILGPREKTQEEASQ